MLIYFERIYLVIFILAEIILFLAKYFWLIYNTRDFAAEIIGLFVLFILNLIKLHYSNTANKTEFTFYHVYSFFFGIPVIIGYIFYLYFQQYCLIFDVSLCAFGLLFSVGNWITSLIEAIYLPNEESKIDNY